MYWASLARHMCEYDLFWRHPSLPPLKPNGVKTDWPDRRGGQSDRPHIVSRISHIHLSGPCVPPERNGESKGIEGHFNGPCWLGRRVVRAVSDIWRRQLSLPLFEDWGIEERDTSAFSLSFLGAICELCSQPISIIWLAAHMRWCVLTLWAKFLTYSVGPL